MSSELADSDIVLRPTTAYVDFGALAANVRAIRAHVGTARMMAIVKANAYGHGLVPTAQALLHFGVDALGVAFLEEGITLRRAGIDAPILVLGGIIGNQIDGPHPSVFCALVVADVQPNPAQIIPGLTIVGPHFNCFLKVFQPVLGVAQIHQHLTQIAVSHGHIGPDLQRDLQMA